MYELTPDAQKIFTARHAAHKDETFEQACERVALHVSNAEQGEERQKQRENFADMLKENYFMPGGRIWYGSGRARGNLLNCVNGDTLVHTKQGLRTARSLAGQTVDTLSQGGVYRSAKWATYGTQELCLVRFENGDEIFATPGHEWIVTKDKGGDERVITRDLEGRLVPMQHLMPSEREIDNEQFRAGVRHGLIFGDGNVNHTGKASMCQFGDSKHLIPDFFDKHSVQFHDRYPEGVTYTGAHDPKLKTTMPTVVEHGQSYVFGFLAGYIASDGNVDSRGSVALHSSKKEDLLKARSLASELGMPCSSITLVRELSPFDGEPAPLYCLRFSKAGIDPRLIIKNKHKNYLASMPVTPKRTTIKVVSVTSTGRSEEVFCCDEPVTHTWVTGDGYLTGNCFVVPTSDSREGWAKTVSDTIIISGTGGGVGCNFSPSRPRGTAIRGTGGESTGAVSEMIMVNSVGEVIKAGGGRRVALMFCLSLSHGDLVEFLDKKLDLKELNNANVSVVFDDDPDKFFELVKADGEWPLLHQGKQVGSLKAKALWDRIVKNALKGGEPGLLNGFLANKMSNIAYLEPLTSTNPCQPAWATVLTPDGIRTFQDIDVGSTIWSGKRWTKVIRKVATGVKPVKAYRTRAGTFYGTENHRVVQNGVKIEAKDAEAIDMSLGPEGSDGFHMRQDVIDGLVLGDGVYHEASRRVFLCAGPGEIEQYRNALGDMIGEHRPTITGAGTCYQVKTTYDFVPLTYERSIRTDMFAGNVERKAAFLRGLYSANGSVVANRITFKAASYKLIEQVQQMLSSMGIASYVTVNKAHDVQHHNGLYTSRESYDLNIGSRRGRELFSNLIGFIQQHKADKLRASFDGPLGRPAKSTYDIVEVADVSEEEVFDITVDDSEHVYWTGGVSVSNCGEIWMSPYDCCCLGALVLPRFVRNGKVDWDLMKIVVTTGVRFLDDVLTVNQYPLPEIAAKCAQLRRIGLGVTGLHHMLLELGLPYNSPEGLEFVDLLMKRIKNWSYEASSGLAVEKGSFPAFDADKFLRSGFCKTLQPSLRALIRKYGMRNCAVNTIAPTGTISMICDVSSGIEPIFAAAYKRRYRKGDEIAEMDMVDPIFKRYVAEGKSVKHFVGSHDLSPRDHLEMQRVCQKHVDNAVSKTINLPQSTPPEILSELYMEFFPDLKGVTIYPEGSRENQPLTPYSLDVAEQLAFDAIGATMSNTDCAKGVCDV